MVDCETEILIFIQDTEMEEEVDEIEIRRRYNRPSMIEIYVIMRLRDGK